MNAIRAAPSSPDFSGGGGFGWERSSLNNEPWLVHGVSILQMQSLLLQHQFILEDKVASTFEVEE